MSHWPRKVRNRRRRQRFWTKLLLVSFVAHSAVLFTVLFLYKGDYFSYDVTVSTKLLRSGAPVVFMPFHKMVNRQPVVDTVKKIVGKTKNGAIKARKKKTTVAVAPRPKKKLVAKKEQVQKKQEKVKDTLEKKKEVQKTASAVANNPSPKGAMADRQKSVAKKVVAQKQEHQVARKAAQSTSEQAPIYVGQVEMDALRMQEQLQREMSQHWKPPVGLTKDLKCVLKVLVDWSGKVSETEVHKSSGVLMYDISARTAVARMQMPQWARGKEFNMTFKQ